jgi:error-prone DNA polymerase
MPRVLSAFLRERRSRNSLFERAVVLEMPAMALLDRNGVYGSARFHTSAKRNGIRAHIGVEIAVSDFGRRLIPPTWLPHQHLAEPTRLPLLCESREGYQNLCRLITQFKMREMKKNEGAATFSGSNLHMALSV